jgi:hypothetical protein
MIFGPTTLAHSGRSHCRFFAFIGFGLLVLLPLLLFAPSAGAGGPATVLSFANTNSITIFTQNDPSYGNASPFPSIIQAPFLPGALQSLTVTVYGLTVPETGPMELMLVGPSGQAVDLMEYAGSGPAGGAPGSNATITIADSGGSFPGPGVPLSTGTYQPSGIPFPPGNFANDVTTNVLAGFIGTPLAGTWSLYEYYDDFGSDGLISGGWSLTFTLVPAAPAITNEAASAITSTNATLSATVQPNLSATTVYFEYGLTTNYGSSSATYTLVSGLTNAQTVSLPITGLPSGTNIHFQAVAQNSAGTTLGGDTNFATLAPPPPPAPVLAASLTNGTSLVLTLYGTPGSNYTVLSATSLLPPIQWTSFTNLTLTNASQVINAGPLTNQLEFFSVGVAVTPPAPPVLVASLTNGASLVLTLYGNPGSSYVVKSATSLSSPVVWTTFTNFTLPATNTFQVINPGPLTNQMEYFRAAQQ